MTINLKRLTEISKAIIGRNKKHQKCDHISFIFKKSKLLSIGSNKYKTHPKTKDYNYHDFAGIHSELDATLKLGLSDAGTAKGLTIVNVRIDKNGNVCNSAPCPGCSDLIKTLSFKEVFYTNNSGTLTKLI